MNHRTKEYVDIVGSLRADASARRQAERENALRETGDTVEGLTVLEVIPNSGSPAELRLSETRCSCGETIGLRPFVYWKKSNGHLHVDCLNLASPGSSIGDEPTLW